MKLPKFLLGSHPSVTRACIRVAEALATKGATLDDVEGDLVDTSSSDARLVLEQTPGLKGFLLYPLVGAFWQYHVASIRDDEAFRRKLVESCLQKEWSLACLFPANEGPQLVHRSGLAWEFLEAVDRAWPCFVDLGNRFSDPRDPLYLSQQSTTIEYILGGYGVKPQELPFRRSMDVMRRVIQRVLSGDKRDLPPWPARVVRT